MADQGTPATEGGGGGTRLDPCFQTECKAVAMILEGKGGRPPSDADIRNARVLIRKGKKSPFARNQLAAARVAVAVAEAERRHVRWAMDYAQRERHHQDKMRGFVRRLDLMEQGQQAPDPGGQGQAGGPTVVNIIVNDAGGQRTFTGLGDFYANCEATPPAPVALPSGGVPGPEPEQGGDGGPKEWKNGMAHR